MSWIAIVLTFVAVKTGPTRPAFALEGSLAVAIDAAGQADALDAPLITLLNIPH